MIIGMMWNKNEGDILEEIIYEACTKVDSLFIADDGSVDKSWEIIKSMQQRYNHTIEYIQRNPDKEDPAQRNSLLNKIRCCYNPEDIWVQTIESDIILLDDPKDYLHTSSNGIYVWWNALNAIRYKGTWGGLDKYPEWGGESITNIMPYAHYMEIMLYTFRPFEGLHYVKSPWRPWPKGFAQYLPKRHKYEVDELDAPLLVHYGYRGPTHWDTKIRRNGAGRYNPKYGWDMGTKEKIEENVWYFNGMYDKDSCAATRESWEVKCRSKIA